MENVISIIVPVYNVQDYLEECVDSLLAQTYEALEIILVDDGSLDNCPAICDSYAEKDSRVRVIHKENGGAASAKNEALKIATGKYLTFVDGDDYVEPDAMAHMQSLLEQHHAQIIHCCLRNVYVDSFSDGIVMQEFTSFTVVEYLERFTKDWTCALHCGKLFYRELFDGVFFEVGNKVDDEFFTYRGVLNASTVIYDPKVVYHYRQRKSSVTLRADSQERIVLDKLNYLQKRRKNVTERFPELTKQYEENFVRMLLWLARDPYSTQESLLQIKQLVKEYLSGPKCCRHHWSVWLGLLQIRFWSVSKLLKHKYPVPPTNHSHHYFD